MQRWSLVFTAAGLLIAIGVKPVLAGPIFSDDFDLGASPLWGNEVGNWSDAGGVYNATSPSNFPNSHSTLPFDLTDFAIDVDVNSVSDGGIWLRSAPAPATSIGIKGVLLVTGAGATGGTGLYWHVVPDGTSYGASLNAVSGLFPAGSNPHIHVEVEGNTYKAFVNGATTPANTLTTSTFASGQVALYDYAGQTFDNVVLVPEPAAAVCMVLGLSSAMILLRRRSAA